MEHKSRLTPRCCANRTPVLEGSQSGYRRVAGNSQEKLSRHDKGSSRQETFLRDQQLRPRGLSRELLIEGQQGQSLFYSRGGD